MKNAIEERVDLPPGYWVEYGGTFEQLESASNRLAVVVPLTLCLIIGLLVLALQSVRDAAAIFSGVPLTLTDNLSEEARKGMQEKAEQGIWPTVAPLGYRNVTCPDGKKMTKQKYVYYHCTGHKGKCREPYVREEVLEEKFATLLGGLRFDDETMSWIRDALTQSHADELRDHEAAIERLPAEYDRLQNRGHAAYIDKLDGGIDAAFFDRISDEWRREQEQCLRDIEHHQGANQSYLDEGVQFLELARNAQRLFAKQEAKKKRRLLGFLGSNCSWGAGSSPPSCANPLIFFSKPSPRPKRKKPPNLRSTAFLRFGSPGRTRTCDKAVNSRLLYQLSYRGTDGSGGRSLGAENAFATLSVRQILLPLEFFGRSVGIRSRPHPSDLGRIRFRCSGSRGSRIRGCPWAL